MLAALSDPMLAGGVSDRGAKIFARTDVAVQVAMQYATTANFAAPLQTAAVTTSTVNHLTAMFDLPNLSPDTKYYYRPVIAGVVQPGAPVQSFTTFPAAGTAEEFSFAVLADLENAGSNPTRPAPAYASVAASNPAFVMQIGDFDHRNPTSLGAMRNMHRQVRNSTSAAGADFAQHVAANYPFFHIWDDHDYGTDDGDKTFLGRAAALQAFNEYYPTPTRPNPAGIWHSFEYAQAEFFMLDVRAQSDPRRDPDGPAKSMLDGDNIANGQLQWLKTGLLDSTATWKFLVSGVPFNPGTKPYDAWGAYDRERRELLDFISANDFTGVVIISGDFHSGGALDDGTNAGLPEISVPHTNLNPDRPTSGTIGTWSHGYTSGSLGGGYAWITVGADGVRLAARGADGALRRELIVAAPTPPEALLSIAAASANKAEGNVGTTPFTFTVTRSGATSGSTSVAYAVTSGAAPGADAADFGGALPNDTVSFAPGQTSQTITINVQGDAANEAAENFLVTLANPSAGGRIATAAAAGVIQNDDAQTASPGLKGDYFNDINLTQLATTRVDSTINFKTGWGAAPPGTAVTPDAKYSARWTGFVQIPTTGNWTLYTTSNDGVRLWVDNVLIIDNWVQHNVVQDVATRNLAAGWRPVQLEFFQHNGAAEITLSYKGPGQVKTIIPQTRLRTSDPGATLAPMAMLTPSPSSEAAFGVPTASSITVPVQPPEIDSASERSPANQSSFAAHDAVLRAWNQERPIPRIGDGDRRRATPDGWVALIRPSPWSRQRGSETDEFEAALGDGDRRTLFAADDFDGLGALL